MRASAVVNCQSALVCRLVRSVCQAATFRGQHLLVRDRPVARQSNADLRALINTGRGDVPLVQLRWRCSWCHSTRIDAVVMAKDSDVLPW
jgi:hypothetical protein